MLHRIWTITGSPLRVLSAAEKRTGSYHLQGAVMLSGVEAPLRTQLRQMGFLARSGFHVSAIDGLDYTNFQKAPIVTESYSSAYPTSSSSGGVPVFAVSPYS
jgi:hypothetical protein